MPVLTTSSTGFGWRRAKPIRSCQAVLCRTKMPVSSRTLRELFTAPLLNISSVLGFCRRSSTRNNFLLVYFLEEDLTRGADPSFHREESMTPCLDARSSEHGTVTTHTPSSGTASSDALKQGRTSPVIISRPPAGRHSNTYHCSHSFIAVVNIELVNLGSRGAS